MNQMSRPVTRSVTRAEIKATNVAVDEDGEPYPLMGRTYTIRELERNIANLLQGSYYKKKGKENPHIFHDGCCEHDMDTETALKTWNRLLVDKRERIAQRLAYLENSSNLTSLQNL